MSVRVVCRPAAARSSSSRSDDDVGARRGEDGDDHAAADHQPVVGHLRAAVAHVGAGLGGLSRTGRVAAAEAAGAGPATVDVAPTVQPAERGRQQQHGTESDARGASQVPAGNPGRYTGG